VDQHSSVNPGEDDLTTISDPQVVIRHNVRANVPYLRRFGRAITGSQTRADICVVQLMEDLLVDPGLIEDGVTPKAALYRRFLDIMHSVPGGGGSSDVPTPLERQAYLLTTVEGFDFAQASNVLNVSVADLSRMIEDVQAQLSSQAGARTLIIEDEPLIAAHLKLQVKQLGHEVIGTAPTHEQAIRKSLANRPQLILSDVQLADGSSGIDAVDEIQNHFDVPVIFITAYPERLLTGKRPEPIFLITKPYVEQAVKATISQALFLNEQARAFAMSAH